MQLNRLVAVIFLGCLPFFSAEPLGHANVFFCFVVNIVYFTLDLCASQMETPFTNEVNSIAFEKMLRRIDKHTAVQLGHFLGRPVFNFDLHPETRKTDAEGGKLKTGRMNITIYDLDAKTKQKKIEDQMHKEAQAISDMDTNRAQKAQSRLALTRAATRAMHERKTAWSLTTCVARRALRSSRNSGCGGGSTRGRQPHYCDWWSTRQRNAGGHAWFGPQVLLHDPLSALLQASSRNEQQHTVRIG